MTTKDTMISKLGSEEAYKAYMREIAVVGGNHRNYPPRTCKLCPRKHFGKGYCSRHYYLNITKKRG